MVAAVTNNATQQLQQRINNGDTGALATLNFDTFLTMLTTQLQNQDPLNPMEGTEFTEQIATFASLEQQIQSNSYLEKLSGKNDLSAQALAVSYIGKDVLAPGKTMNLAQDGGSADFAVDLQDTALATVIQIFGPDGTAIRTMEGPTQEGMNKVEWDGLMDDGSEAPAGDYRVAVSAVDGDGKIVNQTFTYSEVDQVEGQSENLTLTLASGQKVSFEDVQAVREVKDNQG